MMTTIHVLLALMAYQSFFRWCKGRDPWQWGIWYDGYVVPAPPYSPWDYDTICKPWTIFQIGLIDYYYVRDYEETMEPVYYLRKVGISVNIGDFWLWDSPVVIVEEGTFTY